jgi:hypothetical protein
LPLLHRLLAATALAGALLLLVAELSPLYRVVVGALATPRRSVGTGAHHGYGLALVALVAPAMTLGGVRGVRAAAVALAVLGAVALLVALAIDLPATRDSGTLPEAIGFADARAQAGRGLALEIAGGLALLAAGIGMLLLARPRER